MPRSNRRTKKGSQFKPVSQARVIGGEDEKDEDPDKPKIVANRRNRREQGERGTIAPTLGGRADASQVSVKDILRAGKRRKGGPTGQPEHFQKWTADSQARRTLSTQPITVLEPSLGAKVKLIHDAGYKTARDVANEYNYTKLLGIKGVGPAFLGKLRDYLIATGFTVRWQV